MRVTLAYGTTGLPVDFRRPVDVIEPAGRRLVEHPQVALRDALRQPIESPPLREIAASGDRVAIVISDVTRPAPNRAMVRALLHELAHVPREQILLMIATGLHRPCTQQEIEGMLGADIAHGYPVMNHDAADEDACREIGRTTSGRPVAINREYLDADVRITAGLIEPHFFAGFSGGAKLVLPGVAAAKSIMSNHDATLIGDPMARWGQLAGNPIHREQREAARLAGCEFTLNVTVNPARDITGIYAGALEAAHDTGCRELAHEVMRGVDEPYDVVVTTNGGFPLDLNLYQAVKGMDAGAQVVRAGGHVVCAAECREGAGHGAFVHMLRDHEAPADMLASIVTPGHHQVDQWQNQIFARVLDRATVHLHADGLDDAAVREAFCEPCPDIAERVEELAGSGGRVCVLPRGPETIPYVENPS
ncbi:MAG: nickel-dependent lactate racemase [Chloroflexota bacterium]|nr:nickel-dependent lactate racemase [Chloroflexota bacterium]